MSLINQVLQDLDRRHATDKGKLGDGVRALPSGEKRNGDKHWLLPGLLVAAVAGVGAWWYLQSPQATSAPVQPPAMAIVPQSSPAVPPPAPAPEVAPVAVQSPEAAKEVAPALPEKGVEKPVDKPVAEMPTSAKNAANAAKPAGKAAGATGGKTGGGDAGLKLSGMLASVPAPEAAPAPERPPAAGHSGEPRIDKRARVATSRERAESEYRKAISALNQGRSQEAVDALRAAVNEDATHPQALNTLVGLLLELKRTDEALAVMREKLAANPAQPALAVRLARNQFERKDYSAAWTTLSASMPHAGGSAEYHGFAAAVLQKLGRHKEAVEQFQTALKASPGEGRWWMGMGVSLEADGRAADSREAFSRAKASGNLPPEVMSFVEQKLR